jgi:hypothetical protein
MHRVLAEFFLIRILLEITEIKEFRIISESVFLSDHASPITSGVPKLLCCISYTVSLRESLCWRLTTAETELIPLFHNLDAAISSILTLRLLVLIPSWRNWTISLLDDILSFSLSDFVLSCCFSHTVTKHQSIYIEISHTWIGVNTHFQPIGMRMHLFSPSSFGSHTDYINSTSPSWRLLMRNKSLHTDK